VTGCEPGGLCRGTALVAAPAPESCDPHPAIFAVDAVIGDVSVRIVNAHPSASNRQCRTEQIQGLFEEYMGAQPVADPGLNILIMGDLNLHPFSDFTDSSIELWRAYVGEGKAYYYLSGPAEHDPPYPTNAGRTIDHVVTNFAAGNCMTLGRSRDAPRFDGTYGDVDPEGTDHSPLVCELVFTQD
jgi:endonuclease/exonuclease/phosphatase family metal-dependent hydrolase